MADYNLEAKITADASGYEAGVKKAEKASKKLSTTISGVIKGLGKNGLVGALGAVGLASQGLTSTLGAVVKIARKVSETMNECTNAYKAQLIAERSLDTAIQNNPFVTGASADALKEFASEMQKVSNYGDEELIPMMANLVSLGRTETETMQIMSVAMDMSAGMGISLDTAITQLNATLNGNIGRLGQQNAELKGLTEEELRQGKAVEILGEKFKGLSSATADTSKQLQNIKGDFKEALGQFTLPSSDMWNKFWSGFYEKGIEVLKKLDDYLDINTIGKKIFDNIQDEAKKIAKSKKLKIGDVLGDFNFISEQLSALSEKELSVLKKSLEGIKDRTDIEQYWLNMVLKRLHNIELEADQERANAEAEARRAKAEEERLTKEKELADLRKKQEEEREKALKVQETWEDKLFNIRIENLEKTREKELENEELTQEQRLAINDFYGSQILAMKIKQLEEERDEILKDDKLTEEARVAVSRYYENKITQAKQTEADKALAIKKKENKEETKEDKKKFSDFVKMAMEATKKVAETFKNVAKKIGSTMKNVLSGIGNIFGKALDIFNFNPDDALVSLLKIEDSILTFFVETLPKLPAFFASAIQSIMVLLNNLVSSIDWNSVQEILNTIIDMIIKNAPAIISNLMKVVINIAQTLLNGIMHFLKSGGWKIFLDFLLEVQKTIENFVVDNIDEIADTIAKMMPALVNMLVKSIVSASKTLEKIIKPVLKIIGTLIDAILKVVTSNEVISASIEAIKVVVQALVSYIIGNLIPILLDIVNAIIQSLPEVLPSLIIALVEGIAEGLSTGLIDFFRNVNWGDLFAGLGNVLRNIANDFLAILTGGISSVVSGQGKGKGSTGGRIIKGLLTGGLSEVFGFANGSNSVPKGLSIVGEAGPELVRFRGGEQVLNNRNTNKALENMGGKTNNFNVTFNNLQDTTAFNMMQQLKAYNRQMAINGVI